MKAVILAGGMPSTISDEYEGMPKPMVEIGGRPILWHIMKMYSCYGINDFIICAGYKSQMIKNYFRDFYIYQSDITVNLEDNSVEIHNKMTEPWIVTVLDTGLNEAPGSRILMARNYIGDDPFFVSYGDCVSNINITEMVNLYKEEQKTAIVALAHPTGRNIAIPVSDSGEMFEYSNAGVKTAWVNATTMLFNNYIFDILENNRTLELELFKTLEEKSQIVAYRHDGFWSSMETRRDRMNLESLWQRKCAPWKVWDN